MNTLHRVQRNLSEGLLRMASCIEWGIIVHPDDELFITAFDMLCPLCEEPCPGEERTCPKIVAKVKELRMRHTYD
jgi:hypothetical protein